MLPLLELSADKVKAAVISNKINAILLSCVQVSHDTIVADWHQAFIDTFGAYHHFEWAVGTGEGKCDILDYENVGLSGRVQVSGLDLSGFNACYIMLRAWKLDGRCTELSVKAHALKGQQCVHCRLVVGDGFVTITRGENIRRFFEHAEEAEEEEVVKFVRLINHASVFTMFVYHCNLGCYDILYARNSHLRDVSCCFLFRMRIPWTRTEMNWMVNALVLKNMPRVLNLLGNFF